MSPRVTLLPIPHDVLRLLADWDLVEASRRLLLDMPPDVLDQQWVWNAFHARIRQAPENEFWMTRYFAVEDGRVVASLGAHCPPDDDGLVTIGYRVDATERRRGVAVAATRQLLDLVAAREETSGFKALVSPTNLASLAVCDRLGFVDVGEERHTITGQTMRRLELNVR